MPVGFPVPDTQVTFSLINRSKDIRLAELIDEGELREQLDHIRSLSLSRGSTWLRGNTFYGKRQMFIDCRSGSRLRLPPYHLKRDGRHELTFEARPARGDALGDPGLPF